jgi:hypothetical protein
MGSPQLRAGSRRVLVTADAGFVGGNLAVLRWAAAAMAT